MSLMLKQSLSVLNNKKQQGDCGFYKGEEEIYPIFIPCLPTTWVLNNCCSGLHIAQGIQGICTPTT